MEVVTQEDGHKAWTVCMCRSVASLSSPGASG